MARVRSLGGHREYPVCDVEKMPDNLPDIENFRMKDKVTTVQAVVRGHICRRRFRRLRRCSFVTRELVQTEKAYIRALETLRDVFYRPLITRPTPPVILSPEDICYVFEGLEPILKVNMMLLAQLLPHPGFQPTVGQAFVAVTPLFALYVGYCNRYESIVKLITDRAASNSWLADFLKEALKDPRTQGLSLESFLVRPIQRIAKYHLLLQVRTPHIPLTWPRLIVFFFGATGSAVTYGPEGS